MQQKRGLQTPLHKYSLDLIFLKTTYSVCWSTTTITPACTFFNSLAT